MRVLKEDSLAVIIDIQELLFPLISEYEIIEKNTITLIKGLKELGIDIIVTQQYTKGLLPTVASIANTIGKFEHIEKMSFSCCDEAKFVEELVVKGKKYIIIAGIEAHVCVLQTVVDLIDLGYQPVIVEDCISSRNINDKKVAIERMKTEGAIITTYESLLFELLQYSGTASFKAISKLVK